jgi:hypothetical protein
MGIRFTTKGLMIALRSLRLVSPAFSILTRFWPLVSTRLPSCLFRAAFWRPPGAFPRL